MSRFIFVRFHPVFDTHGRYCCALIPCLLGCALSCTSHGQTSFFNLCLVLCTLAHNSFSTQMPTGPTDTGNFSKPSVDTYTDLQPHMEDDDNKAASSIDSVHNPHARFQLAAEVCNTNHNTLPPCPLACDLSYASHGQTLFQ